MLIVSIVDRHRRRHRLQRSRWEQVLLFLNRGDFGYADPLFGKRRLLLRLHPAAVEDAGELRRRHPALTFIATAFTYVVDRAMVLNAKNRVQPRAPREGPPVGDPGPGHGGQGRRLHDPDLGAQLLTQSAAVFGASYTDVHARCRCSTSWPSSRWSPQPSSWSTSATGAGACPPSPSSSCSSPGRIAGKAYPAIIQQYRVSPNEIAAESALHREQHRGHPLGLRTGRDDERPLRAPPTT